MPWPSSWPQRGRVHAGGRRGTARGGGARETSEPTARAGLPGGGEFVPDARRPSVLWPSARPDGDAHREPSGSSSTRGRRTAALPRRRLRGLRRARELTDPTYEGSYPTCSRTRRRDRGPDRATVGNHEWEDGAAAGYDTYWSDVYDKPVQHTTVRRRWLGGDQPQLEVETDADDPQGAARVRADRAGTVGSSSSPPPVQRGSPRRRPGPGRHLERLEGHATLVVSGHDHDCSSSSRRVAWCSWCPEPADVAATTSTRPTSDWCSPTTPTTAPCAWS